MAYTVSISVAKIVVNGQF